MSDLPKDFIDKMQRLLKVEAASFFSSYDGERTYGLRRNPLKIGRKEFLEKMPFTLEPVPWARDGYYYLPSEQPGKHVFHEAGAYYIQEPSAMAVAEAVDARPGERICDLCAAPGGKTTQLAGQMKGKGLLVANEIHPGRAKILSQNVERMGICNAVVLNQSPETLEERFLGFFDKILVDAPCSGEGMFRKDENAMMEWSLEHVTMCAKRQAGILECAANMLKNGGLLVYSTCTFSPEENEGTVSAFCRAHEDFSIEEMRWKPHVSGKSSGIPMDREEALAQSGVSGNALFDQGRSQWIEEPIAGLDLTCRMWPHRLKGEGHFVARLRKEDGLGKRSRELVKKEKDSKKLADYERFAKEYLLDRPEGTLCFLGDTLYAVPEEMPDFSRLRVLRAGLEVGKNKKNRFEPSHALGMAYGKEKVCTCVSLSWEEAERYQRGESLMKATSKGWVFLETEGIPMGIGKSVNGTIKNHYPKGIRRYA